MTQDAENPSLKPNRTSEELKDKSYITTSPARTDSTGTHPTSSTAPLSPAQLRLIQPRTAARSLAARLSGCLVDAALFALSCCFLALGLTVYNLDGDRVSSHPKLVSYLTEAIRYASQHYSESPQSLTLHRDPPFSPSCSLRWSAEPLDLVFRGVSSEANDSASWTCSRTAHRS